MPNITDLSPDEAVTELGRRSHRDTSLQSAMETIHLAINSHMGRELIAEEAIYLLSDIAHLARCSLNSK